MGKSVFLMLAFIVSIFAAVSEPEKELYNKIKINNNMYSNAYVDGECKCCHFFGQTLKDCLSCLDKEELIENLNKLGHRAFLQYLLLMDFGDYKEFLSNFSDEEWAEFYAMLDERKQKHLKPTRKEHQALIDLCEGVSNEEVAQVIFSLAKAGATIFINPNPVGCIFAALGLAKDGYDLEEVPPQTKFAALQKRFFNAE